MAAVIAKIKQKQIAQLVDNWKRLDGREITEYREIRLEQGMIERAEGSARVFIGKTDVVVGTKVEMGEPFTDTPNEGVLTVNAELVPLASPSYEAGPPDENSIELARIVDRGIRESKMIDTDKLVIEAGKKVFVVFVDVYVLNHDGNLIDASALAAVAALMNTKMPNYEVEDGEVKIKSGFTDLPIRQHPVTVTCAKIGSKLVVDPGFEEEQVMDARLSMAIDDDGNICAIQKGGAGYFTPEQVVEFGRLAVGKAKEMRKKLDW
jgi:exosome complex component RRP42